MIVNKYNFFPNTEQPMLLYVIKASALAVIVGNTVALLLDLFFPHSIPPMFDISINTIVEAILFAPLIETLFMIPVFIIAKRFISNKVHIALISAIFWGCIHSLQNPLWGIGVFTLFFIMSIAYQYWVTYSQGHALLIVFLIHAINNSFVIFIIFTLDFI